MKRSELKQIIKSVIEESWVASKDEIGRMEVKQALDELMYTMGNEDSEVASDIQFDKVSDHKTLINLIYQLNDEIRKLKLGIIR